MKPFPKSLKEWTRSLCHALFAGCVTTWVIVLFFSMSSRYLLWWFYAAPVIGRFLLPALGGLLGVSCVLSSRVHVRFRVAALLLAAISILLGPTLPFAIFR
jgi:hypothetical protein